MSFTWIPIYRELAGKVLNYRSRQSELLMLLEELRGKSLPVVPLEDKDKQRSTTPLKVIDPFTFFSSFNRSTTEDNRKQILKFLKERLDLKEAIPDDFDGLPLANNQHSWFFAYGFNRQPKDIDKLWDLAESVVEARKATEVPAERFNAALEVKGTGRSLLTMGCFWLNPTLFLGADSVNRRYFREKHGFKFSYTDYNSYLTVLDQIKKIEGGDFPRISYAAFQQASQKDAVGTEKKIEVTKPQSVDLTISDSYPLSQLALETGMNEDDLRMWIEAIERKGQAVIYGPPGTGKTYIAERIARHLTSDSDGMAELVQFHPEYAYQDFMQGIRPDTHNGQLSYSLIPGIFLRFCQMARERKGRCILIIDEINRANLSRVFGELMYLLEYRDREIELAGGERFSIPSNVRLIGTMNTADRSIALVDFALRRRFAFLHLGPNLDILRMFHRDTGFSVDGLIQTLRSINAQIGDPNYEIGITFFMHQNLAERIEAIWKLEIEPYLEEYFFDSPSKIDPFRWDTVKGTIL